MIPFRLCFEVDAEGGLKIFEIFIDVFFMLDICNPFSK